jgi:hypothetical protein
MDLEISIDDWLSSAWDNLIPGDSSDDSSDDSSEDKDSSEGDTSSNKDKWWYGNPPALKWPRPEAIRMADMKSADEAETIEIRVFHNGNIKAARVSAVYIEFALRDAWGDRYHIDVSIHNKPLKDVKDEEDWWEWVDNHPEDTVKDCNILVPHGGGWPPQAAADTAVAIRGKYIDDLYMQTLYVNGSSKAHDEISTVLHELLHCLGFEHKEGGTIGSAVTPMGHYEAHGDTYSARLHPNVKSMEPTVV